MIVARLQNETFKEYRKRLCSQKEELSLSWKDIRDNIKKEFNVDLAESTHRGWWKDYSEGFTDGSSSNKDDALEEFQSKVEALEISKMQMQDQKRELRNLLRIKARSQHLQTEITKAIQLVSKEKPIVWRDQMSMSSKEREGILLLSDWHFGLIADNFFNIFNPEVFHKRVDKLLQETITYGKEMGMKKIHVMNLGDMISGSIHISTRVHSSEDVISQTMHVAETLCYFVSSLSEHFPVSFYSVRGNHDRVSFGDKSAETAKESYAEILPWYMKARLSHIKAIEFVENTMDDEMIVANVMGHTIFGVHGHKDKMGTAIQNLSLLTNVIPYMIVMGHYHHDELREIINGHLAVMNSSLCGIDEHARDIRKGSRPAQKLLCMSVEGLVCPINIYLDEGWRKS